MPYASPRRSSGTMSATSARAEGMGPLLVAEQRERGYASQQPDFKLVRAKVIVSE